MYVPSPELGLSYPLSRQRVCPSPRNQMGGWEEVHKPAGEGLGSPNSDDWKKLSTLPTMCFLAFAQNKEICLDLEQIVCIVCMYKIVLIHAWEYKEEKSRCPLGRGVAK